MKKYLFIINPISGWGRGKKYILKIKKLSQKYSFFCKIEKTTAIKDAFNIANRHINSGFKTIVAVGGDGTINEVATALISKNIALGIIPCGSGNGLARHLKIPFKLEKAIKKILENNIKKIDSCTVNNTPFFMLLGIGFDAIIAQQFAKNNTRTFWGYAKLIITTVFKDYKNEKYIIHTNKEKIKTNALMITFANATQFGNGFYISPKAKINDGLLDICIVKKIPLINIPMFIFKMITKKIHKSKFVEIKQCKSAMVSGVINVVNLDGESVIIKDDLKINIKPESLLVTS